MSAKIFLLSDPLVFDALPMYNPGVGVCGSIPLCVCVCHCPGPHYSVTDHAVTSLTLFSLPLSCSGMSLPSWGEGSWQCSPLFLALVPRVLLHRELSALPQPLPWLCPFRSVLGFCALAVNRYLPRLAPRRSPGLSEGPQDRSVQSLTQHSPAELGAESLIRPFPARQ